MCAYCDCSAALPSLFFFFFYTDFPRFISFVCWTICWLPSIFVIFLALVFYCLLCVSWVLTAIAAAASKSPRGSPSALVKSNLLSSCQLRRSVYPYTAWKYWFAFRFTALIAGCLHTCTTSIVSTFCTNTFLIRYQIFTRLSLNKIKLFLTVYLRRSFNKKGLLRA